MIKKLATILLVAVLASALFLGYKIVRWKAYVWLPDYVAGVLAREDAPADSTVHVIFVFIDHYEPGLGDAGAEWNRRWLEGYKALASGHRDSYGRVPQHTWFYAYDHKNEEVMTDLSRAVGEGYGEIEFHWHHGNDTNESFGPKLEEALRWFSSFGAMVSAGPEQRVRFGFVHGNCALDNSTIPEHCGVTRELDALRKAGCYADFTFPSLGSPGQPSKVNSIYYATDDDAPKSYDTGQDARVGVRVADRLLMFQGPMTLTPSRRLFEYGAVENDERPAPGREESWVSAGVCVKGRPEWKFVKVYTHGAQSMKTCLGPETDAMFGRLEEHYGRDRYRLHYVTAREAYNLVRAAEDGLRGDPDIYRDYEVTPPRNRQK
ncbi:MAG: hypothetical protein JW952_01775 [Candidatus Eisenbacteria bacterium]|nr:hypothetical protein [Candidatus Eisenbacteria bacterium]